jgi:hypothetical protein
MPANNVSLSAAFTATGGGGGASGCTALGTPASGAAQMTSCRLSGGTLTLSWTSAGSGTYYVWIGTAQGKYDITSTTQTATSCTFTGITQSVVYVRLFTTVGNTYPYNDYKVAAS